MVNDCVAMKVLFMGRKVAGREALKWTIEQGHDVVGVLTDNHLPGSPTTRLANEYNLPMYNYEEAQSAIECGDLTFDLGVSFVYWRILKGPILKAATRGVINFHPAPLPKYKGTGGYNAAIMDNLDCWAVTAHYVDNGIDTGPIIDMFEFSIDSQSETACSLENKSMTFMLSLYKKTLRRAAITQRLPTRENEGGRYISRREMEAMKRIEPGDDVDRKVRAFWFPPYKGAYVEIDGREYTLVNDEILKSLAPEGTTNLRIRPRTK
jgi:methionyl-tRNA formyltransferase